MTKKDAKLVEMISKLTTNDVERLITKLLFQTYDNRKEADAACDILTRLNTVSNMYPVVCPLNEGFSIEIKWV